MDNFKTPPHSDEAERGILASVLLSPVESMAKAIDCGVEQDSFYCRSHALLFDGIERMISDGIPVDAVSIMEWFKGEGLLEKIGGIDYLMEIQSAESVPAHVEHYAKIICEKHRQRIAIEIASNIADKAYDGDDPEEIASDAMSRIMELSGKSRHNITLRDVANEAYSMAEKIANGEPFGLPFPWFPFQQKTFGIPYGAVTPLSGRDKKGKSRLATYLTHHWLQRGTPGLYFPFEDNRMRFMTNLAATHGGYDAFDVRKHHGGTSFLKKHAKSLDEISKFPLAVCDTVCNIKDIVMKIKEMSAKEGIEFVVIDGFKDIHCDKGENQTARENHIMAQLVKAAREIGPAIIPIMHLTKVEDNHWISKRDIKGSGTQTQSARMVLAYQDSGFPPSLESRYDMLANPNRFVLDCQGASYGNEGCIVLEKDLEHGRFVEVRDDE